MMTLTHVLVATDFGDASATALVYGRELARKFGATLHVLHVVDDLAARIATASEAPMDFGHLQTELEAAADLRLKALVSDEDRTQLRAKAVRLTSSMPARAIASYAKDAHVDVIIMGTHGRGGMAHIFMGSVAERVVRTAPCPVLTVRHPEHEFVLPDALEAVAHK